MGPVAFTRHAPFLAWLVGSGAFAGCGAGSDRREPAATTSAALRQCANAVLEGIDVSDGQGRVDWTAVRTAGVDFAIIKATQGTYDTQRTFAASWVGARAAGVYRSAYHFFDPTEDGEAQAQHFLSVLGPAGSDDLPAMLDIECPTGRADTTCLDTGTSDEASAADIATRMWNFIHAVEQSTGKKPLIYTYGSYFASNGVDTTGLEAYPLAIADPVAGSCFDVPSPWSDAVLWQYSFTGVVPGVSDAVDRDRFIGTLQGLQQFAGGCPGLATGIAPCVEALDGSPPESPDDAAAQGADDGAAQGVDEAAAQGADEAAPGEGANAGLDSSAEGPGRSPGCGCRVTSSGTTAGVRGFGGAGASALAAAFLAGCRRRHPRRRMLAGRSKEPPCRRPTSAKG
jgi:lysozyme